MKKLFLLLTLAGAATAAWAQVTTNVPRTNFDALNATAETVLVKGMTSIGTLNNQINYPVEIRVERLASQQAATNLYAVSLRAKVGPQLQLDYIDYDELDGLIRGVTQLSQTDNTNGPFDNYEVIYRTRSGFALTKLGKGNKLILSMRSGDTNGARNEMASFVLDDFGRFLTAAKAKIDAITASGQ